jgi:hypothetical protein
VAIFCVIIGEGVSVAVITILHSQILELGKFVG